MDQWIEPVVSAFPADCNVLRGCIVGVSWCVLYLLRCSCARELLCVVALGVVVVLGGVVAGDVALVVGECGWSGDART